MLILWERAYRQNSSQRSGHIVTISSISEAVSVNILGDVNEELVEECHLEEFVECDQLEVGDALSTDDSWGWTVWECSMSALLDQRQLTWTWVGQAIGEFALNRSWGLCGGCIDQRNCT